MPNRSASTCLSATDRSCASCRLNGPLSTTCAERMGCFRDGHGPELLAALLDCVASHHPVAIEHCTLQLETPALARAHAAHLHG